ncbi:hypothetical protein [Pseudomonas sp. SWRI99]|uniref:hypothetical protein n=1 Tax=Pseudomonas sp. SWRI99 TaxID=2745506 RepID=UPI001647DE2C|nr:hypothetical protein [Pseudomonas sp. SWRI99]MBC3775528.1 hypothetical protein [Pseudomonas sp. SWRI99]
MSVVEKNKSVWSTEALIVESQLRSDADAAERRLMIAQLEEALNTYSDDQTIKWYAHELELQEGSSLYEIYNPGTRLLNQLLETVPVNSALSQERASDHDGLVRVTADGKMEVRAPAGWVDLIAAGHFESSRSTLATLKLITDMAEAAGGYIWPDLFITMDQWFKFHEIDIPESNAKVRNLLALLNFDPQVQEPANYWEHFETDHRGLATLPEQEFPEIRKATNKLLPGKKLLSALYNVTGNAAVSHDNAAQRIVEYVNYPVARALAQKYLKELGWFGANEGEEISEQVLPQLLLTALLLDLDPSIESFCQRRKIAGFQLYAPTYVDRHPSAVLDDLTAFLRARISVDPRLAPLAAHLLLARTAPELVVREIPQTVVMGSIAWVSFSRGVALVEAVKTGASRALTYAQIMAYAELKPISDAQRQLRDLAMIDPIVDWALLNEVVTSTEIERAEEASTERAIEAFELHTQAFDHIAQAFTKPLPNRVKISRDALKAAVPDCDFIDEEVLCEHNGKFMASMVELHQSGDLVTGEWDRRVVSFSGFVGGLPVTRHEPVSTSLLQQYPALLKLIPCDVQLDRQLAVYRQDLDRAMLSTVKLALAQSPRRTCTSS